MKTKFFHVTKQFGDQKMYLRNTRGQWAWVKSESWAAYFPGRREALKIVRSLKSGLGVEQAK